MVLQLADDLDVLALLPQHGSDRVDVGSFADERGENHVDSVLHAKLQILDVFLGDGGQVHGGAGEVHPLLAAQGASVLNLTVQEIRTWRQQRVQGASEVFGCVLRPSVVCVRL